MSDDIVQPADLVNSAGKAVPNSNPSFPSSAAFDRVGKSSWGHEGGVHQQR